MGNTKLVNYNTGEAINLDKATPNEITEALDSLVLKRKELVKLEKKVKDYLIEKRVDVEDGEFGGYKVSVQERLSVKKPDIKDLPKDVRDKYIKAQEFIDEVNKQYGKASLTQFTVWKRKQI